MTINSPYDVIEGLFLSTKHRLQTPRGNAVDPVNTASLNSGVFSINS